MTTRLSLPKEVAGITLPDSAMATAATRLAQEASPEFLFNHCVRTYVLGSLAGRRAHMTFDPELLYLAAILHDLGLTPAGAGTERFEVDGADAAREFCLTQAVAPDQADRVWDAIALHSTPGIPPRKSPEAALVQIGAGIDVLGVGREVIELADLQRVMAAVPRHGFSRKFIELVTAIGMRKPTQHAFTWVAELGHLYVHGFPGPTYRELFPQWTAVVEPEEGALPTALA